MLHLLIEVGKKLAIFGLPHNPAIGRAPLASYLLHAHDGSGTWRVDGAIHLDAILTNDALERSPLGTTGAVFQEDRLTDELRQELLTPPLPMEPLDLFPGRT
jgi:hypothetical protein